MLFLLFQAIPVAVGVGVVAITAIIAKILLDRKKKKTTLEEHKANWLTCKYNLEYFAIIVSIFPSTSYLFLLGKQVAKTENNWEKLGLGLSLWVNP